jgi:hypothetical protein
MRTLLLLCACLSILSLAAVAQKSGEAYIGFSDFTTGKNGWNGDIGYNLVKTFMVEGDLGGYYSHNNNIHSYTFGVKAQTPLRHRGFNPWGHFLLGGSHVSRLNGSSNSAWSWALGGGVDTMVYKKLGFRLTADVFRTNFNNSSDLHLRAGGGVVYHF